MDGLQWKTLLKRMIWGYPFFGNTQIDLDHLPTVKTGLSATPKPRHDK